MLQLSPLKVECTLFFQENPYTLETLDGLAARLGRKTSDLSLILEHLVTVSILEKIGEGENAIYRYVQPDSLQIQSDIAWE
jgi:hypothetical protein